MLTLPHHNPSLRKVRKGTQDRETGGGDLKQRPQRSAAHRLVLVRCFPWKPEDSNLYPQSAHISGHSGTPFCKTRAPSTRWEVEICPESFRNSTTMQTVTVLNEIQVPLCCPSVLKMYHKTLEYQSGRCTICPTGRMGSEKSFHHTFRVMYEAKGGSTLSYFVVITAGDGGGVPGTVA